MKSVLIIEDDSLVGRTLSSHLAKQGFDVRSAEDGETGLRAYDDREPDLVLLDIRLPDVDGLDILRQIKERGGRSAVLIMTAYDDMKTTVEAVKLGAFEYLVKRADTEVLDVNMNGSGLAYIARDGQIYKVRWSRPTQDSVISLTYWIVEHHPERVEWFPVSCERTGKMATHQFTEDEVWAILCECICRALGVKPEEITPDSRMVEDLGMN